MRACLKVEMLKSACCCGEAHLTSQAWEIDARGIFGRSVVWKDACRVAGAVPETCSSEILGGGHWFPERVWRHPFAAGAALYTDGAEKSQDILVQGGQLGTQVSIFEGRLSEVLRF